MAVPVQDVYTPLFTLEGAVAALWLAGAGAFLAWHLAKYVRFRLRVRRWGAPAEDAALLARFEAAKAELGVKNLALLVCPAVGAPLVTGFVNPALLLPRETVSDGVLRHELIHTRRRDLWYKLLLLLSRSLHWFNPLVHWMAAAASRDLERSCDEAAVAGRDAAFRAAYGAAMLDAVEEGIEARAPLTTHFRGGKAAMKERLLSIASGGTRKKGVALVCAAALVISAGAAACSLGTAEEPRQLNGILDRENYALRGVGEYVAAFDAAGGFIAIWGSDRTRRGAAAGMGDDRQPLRSEVVTAGGSPARLCRPGDHLRYGDVRRRRQSRPPGRGGGGDRGGTSVKLRTWSRMPTCLCGLTRCWWSGPTAGRSCIPSGAGLSRLLGLVNLSNT